MNSNDKMSAYMALLNFLNNNDEKEKTEDDKVFRKDTKEQITNRDKQYSQLLTHFVKITGIRNVIKEVFKWTFCVAIIGSIIVLTVVTVLLFDKYLSIATMEQMIESLPLLTSAIIGFVSAIIVIPATIAKYLFSTKEDDNITQIILHTQEHDVNGRQWAMDFKKMVENMDGSSKQTGVKTQNVPENIHQAK